MTPECRWLSAAQRKEIIEAAVVEIEKRQPSDAPRMAVILGHTITALLERFQAEEEVQKQRERVIDGALWRLSCFATDQEKARAIRAAREVIRQLDEDSDEKELRAAAEEAIWPIQQAIEKRLLKERVLAWAVWQLPRTRTELDTLRVRRESPRYWLNCPRMSRN